MTEQQGDHTPSVETSKVKNQPQFGDVSQREVSVQQAVAETPPESLPLTLYQKLQILY